MIQIPAQASVFVMHESVNFRNGIDGMAALARVVLQREPMSGAFFVFRNRGRHMLRILYYDGGGFWLYYRLLEAGTFEEWKSPDASNHLTIDATELSMLLSGVSLVASRRRRKRYSQPPPEQAA